MAQKKVSCVYVFKMDMSLLKAEEDVSSCSFQTVYEEDNDGLKIALFFFGDRFEKKNPPHYIKRYVQTKF